jgi:hypothetical protein
MKNIFLLHNQLKNLTHKTFSSSISKNFSSLQRIMNCYNFHQSQSTYSFITNLDNKFPLTQIDESVLNNITQDEPISETIDSIEKNIENPNLNVQIEFKGRNSKTPKRVKIII